MDFEPPRTTRIMDSYIFLLFWLPRVKTKFQSVGQVAIFDHLKVTVMFYLDYRTSLSFKTVSKYILFLDGQNFERHIVILNKLISVELSKLRNFPGKNYENLFGIVQNFLFDSAYVTFLPFLIYGKNSDPTLALYICMHANMMKNWNFMSWWKLPISQTDCWFIWVHFYTTYLLYFRCRINNGFIHCYD